MKWEPKDFLLALFLCMAFAVIVGYGIYLFGNFDMNGVKTIMKVGISVILAGVCLCVVGIAISMGFQIWKQEPKQEINDNPTIVFTIEDEMGYIRKFKVNVLKVVQDDKEK